MPTNPLSSRQRALSIAAVVISTLGVGISYGIGYPLTSLTFEKWGLDAWMSGLAGGAPALAIFLLLPLFPRLVGWLGPVQSMTLGCLIVASGFMLMAVLPIPEAWIAIRFLMGAGLALPWLVGETWINTVTTDAARARMIALYSIALFSGFAAGPFLLEIVGIDEIWPFLIGALGIILAVVPILLATRLAPVLPCHSETGVAGALLLVPVAMTGAFLGGFLEMSHFSLLANYAVRNGMTGEEALRFLTVCIAGGVVLQFAIAWLADRLPRALVLIALAVCFVITSTVTAALIDTGWLAHVLIFIVGGQLVSFYTLALAIIGETVPGRDLAVANAAFLIMYQAGAILGPTVSGLAMSASPDFGFIGTMIVGTLVGILVLCFFARRQPKHGRGLPGTSAP